MPAVEARQSTQLRFFHHPCELQDVLTELLSGLRRHPRRIHPKYFYDERGAALFDRITALPEYYPTRCEREILVRYRHVIAEYIGADSVLIEPGSGSSEKVALLLDALRPQLYVPLDISGEHMLVASRRLIGHFPWLQCCAVVADYSTDFELPPVLPAGRRVVFYPGSSIGNFDPPAAVDFLRRLYDLVGVGGGLLIGVDLQKDADILHRAYNDSSGVTAAFNRNALHHINRLVGSDFDPGAFEHVAFYDPQQKRVEMHLESRCDQRVDFGGQPLQFAAGERIHTENSYKYTRRSFAALAARAGFRLEQTWYDRGELFSVHYLVADADALFAGFTPAADMPQPAATPLGRSN